MMSWVIADSPSGIISCAETGPLCCQANHAVASAQPSNPRPSNQSRVLARNAPRRSHRVISMGKSFRLKGRSWQLRLQWAAQHFQVFEQRPAFLRLQQAPDDAITALAGAKFMSAVVIAGDAGVEHKAVSKGFGAIAQVLGVVLEGAFVERGRTFVLGREQLINTRHRTVVQEGRRGPHAGQRPGLVDAQFLDTDRQTEAIDVRSLGRRDVGLAVSMVLNERRDIRESLGHRELAQVQRLGWFWM